MENIKQFKHDKMNVQVKLDTKNHRCTMIVEYESQKKGREHTTNHVRLKNKLIEFLCGKGINPDDIETTILYKKLPNPPPFNDPVPETIKVPNSNG